MMLMATVKKHEHRYAPFKVGYFDIADNLPQYFAVRLFCLEDGCQEEVVAVAEATDA